MKNNNEYAEEPRNRREMHPPGGVSTISFGNQPSSAPEMTTTPNRCQRVRNFPTQSNIFAGENYVDPSRIRTPNAHSNVEVDRAPHASPMNLEMNVADAMMNSSFQIDREEVVSASPSSSRSGTPKMIYDQDSHRMEAPRRPKKQTEESSDSMFSQSFRNGSGQFNKTASVVFSPGSDDDTARGRAAANKHNQNNRGYNVLTGQSDSEASMFLQQEKEGHMKKEKVRIDAASDPRPAAGSRKVSSAIQQGRGRPLDSGPFW